MSLKSKLEAVIYAAEEPVTLTQLATLFGAEALEWKAAEQAAAAQKAEADAAATVIDPSQPMIAEGLEYLDLRTEDGHLLEQPGFAVLPEAEATFTSSTEPQSETVAEEVGSAALEEAQPEPSESAPDVAAQPDPEAEAKRAARQRDREIKAILRQLIDELITYYASDDRGVEIREIAGGYRMATKPECHDAVRMFIKSLKPAMKLSLPALETLAVIAYKQPVTAPEVNEIRGVDSSGVFGSLLARKLITTAGRKQVIGRPILYKTTKEFLMRFGLKDVAELPSMDEFEKMASELEEVEPVAVDEGDAATAAYEAEGTDGPELDENAPEEPDNDSPQPAENTAQTPAAVSETNENMEPAE
ncbi:SMC-Scp complex subunit ScpB [Telmatobacter sp. DSM 110680]|uniref:SMC-Scp complex subunit ScpB n=1 Tax=Telmatobacter sp. DSM 110680 TaxID=3036704 RepID=A0AAU7DMG9_9BACT